jgi:hypothetical protein
VKYAGVANVGGAIGNAVIAVLAGSLSHPWTWLSRGRLLFALEKLKLRHGNRLCSGISVDTEAKAKKLAREPLTGIGTAITVTMKLYSSLYRAVREDRR